MQTSFRPLLNSFLIAALGSTAAAQTFVATPSKLAINTDDTENVDFADVDGDGDLDAALAEGGDSGSDQSNLWINRGFEPGGTIGFFADRTVAQFPSALFQSRDIEFADIDGDGDPDIYLANTSQISSQSSRWWVNMGGAQGGTPGYYQDQTAARWPDLNIAPTSIWASLLLSNGFICWSGDGDFADIDNDGDLDLAHSSYGPGFNGSAPTRLFLNDGSGVFREFNPSGFRLTSALIADGNPALWAQGLQQANTLNNTGVNSDVCADALDVDWGDIDGDFDLDLLHGARVDAPRMFRNNLTENGGALTSFTDVTTAAFAPGWATGSGHYEQEMGDCDNDGDMDIYGLNWSSALGFSDSTLANDGSGFFTTNQVLANSLPDDNEADFLDYDNDGDLDVYVANFSGQDRLYRNDFAGAGFSHTNVTTAELPMATRIALDADCADLDGDGDTDVVVANTANQAEYYFTNQSNVADTHAPRIPNVEQAPGRVTGLAPTVVRAQVYDNASYYETWYVDVVLEYRVAPSGFLVAPMSASQGQIWRGEIPGQIAGLIEYRVRSTDRNGNVGVSTLKSFTASGPGGLAYCTPGTTTNGCSATISASGVPSLAAASGYVLTANDVEGQRAGLMFYGVSGRATVSWGAGGTSTMCVKVPNQRMNKLLSGGTFGACDGVLTQDWLAYLAAQPGALGQPFGAGVVVNAQAWFRDPPAVKSTSLSNALEFVTLP